MPSFGCRLRHHLAIAAQPVIDDEGAIIPDHFARLIRLQRAKLCRFLRYVGSMPDAMAVMAAQIGLTIRLSATIAASGAVLSAARRMRITAPRSGSTGMSMRWTLNRENARHPDKRAGFAYSNRIMLPAKDRLTLCFAHVAYRLQERFLLRQTGMASLEVRSLEELQQRLPEAEDVLVVSQASGRNSLLAAAPRLRFIQSISAGIDQYDGEALKAQAPSALPAPRVQTKGRGRTRHGPDPGS